MQLGRTGRMAFAMIAMVLLILSISSAALIAIVSKESSTETPAVRELRKLADAIEAARIDIENRAYDAAVRVIQDLVVGGFDERNLSASFNNTVDEMLSAGFPRSYEDVSISIDAHSIALQPLVMSTWDIVPAPPSDSPENRWGVNTTGELNVTSRIPYYKVAGIANLTATDLTAPTWRHAKSITVDREVANPYPLLTAGARQVYYESSGGRGELGRVIKYILTTVAQYRALAGYGSMGHIKNASEILTRNDVEMAANLAILLQHARLFRTVDERSVVEFDARNNFRYDSDRRAAANEGKLLLADRNLGRLLTLYMTTGTVDPADLIALYIGLDGVPLDLRRLVDLSASDSIRDMFILRHLGHYHATRDFDHPVLEWFSMLFDTFQRASEQPDSFESLVRKNDMFLAPWWAGAARWASGLVGDLTQQWGLDSRFLQAGHASLLVRDNGRLYPVGATATSRPAKIYSSETNCVDTDPGPPVVVYCDYYYRDHTYSLNSPSASWTLRFDDQVVTDLGHVSIWEDFYNRTINGRVWKTVGQEMITALYSLLLEIVQEIARQAVSQFRLNLVIDPKNFQSVPELVYDAVHAALQGAAEWFLGPSGQAWLLPRVATAVTKTGLFVTHLSSFLSGPIDLLPSCRTPAKVVDYPSGYDCLADGEWRIRDAVENRAGQIFNLTGELPLSSEGWSQGSEVFGGNCLQGTLCGFDYWNQATARSQLRQEGMYADIANQVDGSVRAAYAQLRTEELQSISTAVTAFVGTSPDYAAARSRLIDLVVGPGGSSFAGATVAYIERSVNLVPLHDFLSLKILEATHFERPFEFWLGNESHARDRGRIYRETLAVRQDLPYLAISDNDFVRSAAQSRARFHGQIPENFTGRLGVYLDLLPEGRYNTETVHADRMPFQNRWNVSILGAYELNVSSKSLFFPGFAGPKHTYYRITIPIDLCLTIDPVTTWRLEGVQYRDLFEYVRNLNQDQEKDWWESLVSGFLDLFNLFSGVSQVNVREPVQAIAKHQIAISRYMISQLASGYVDAAVSKTMEEMSNRLTTSEILWTAGILASSPDLIEWGLNTSTPLNLSFPGFEVVARPAGFGVNRMPLPDGMAPWLYQVNESLAKDGYYGPSQGAILRLDIIQGERTFCGDIENSHGSVSTWLVRRQLELDWITDPELRSRFTADVVAPLTYYSFNVRSAQVRFSCDPMRVQQYLWVAGHAKWTDRWGQGWGATVYLPNVEVFFSRGDSADFEFPLIPGVLTLEISFGYSINTFPELDLAVPGQAFINEIGGNDDGTNQWVEIWHPWIPSPVISALFGNWRLVAARGGNDQTFSAFPCTAGNLYFTSCQLPNRFFSPGVAGNPTNPLDSLMLLNAVGHIVDHTPFDEPCDTDQTFQRIIDGARRWVCETESMGRPNWGTNLTQALDQILGLTPGRLGGGLFGMIGFLGRLVDAYRNIGLFAAAILDLSIWFSIKFTILFVISVEFQFTLSIDGDVIASVVLWLMSSINDLFHAIVSSSSSAVKAFPVGDLLSGLWISFEASLGIHTPEIPGAPEEELGSAGAKCGYSWGWNLPRILGWTTDPAIAEESWGTFCEVTVGGPLVTLAEELATPTVMNPSEFGDVEFGVRVWLFRLDKFALEPG